MASAAADDGQEDEFGDDDQQYYKEGDEAIDPHYAQVTNEGRIESSHVDADESTAAVITSPGDKKAQKQLEKEQKERQKREKEEAKMRLKEQERQIKEQEKQIKEEAKKMKAPSRKKEREEGKKKSKASAVVSPQRPGVRPKSVVSCCVHLLDGTDYQFEIEKRAKGSLLVEMVCEHLNLLERDYFSCFYINNGVRFWIILDRRVAKQIGKLPWVFGFGVKFYAPDPSLLQEDITRYFMCLQIRADILASVLPCAFVTHALLGSYTVQSELGDYDAAEFGHGFEYLREFQFCSNQTDELLEKIAQLHQSLRDQTPAEAELNYLNNATKLELYGVELQPAKDAEMVNINVGVSAMGLCVYRDQVRVNRFPWPVVLKMSYKKSNFYVKIRPAEREQFITTLAFSMPNHELAKRFWRLAIEHHSFFRLKAPMPVDRGVFERFGSAKHRFSGRTYYQSHTWAASITRPPPYFERQMTSSRSLGAGSMVKRSFDEDRDRSRQYDPSESQIAVVAGTAPAASRVAYIKTVQPEAATTEALAEGETSYEQNYRLRLEENAAAGVSSFRSGPGRGANEQVIMADISTNEKSYENGDEFNESATNSSFSRSAEENGAGPKKKKKKKTTTVSTTTTQYTYNDEDGNVVTEYKTEKNGVVETRVERRAVIGRQEIDHDLELSKAINSVMDMRADLSVEQIEINPTEVAHSMVASSDTQKKIEIKTKKTKKKTKHEKITE
jgi:erythrocyte membrane protein band 4.1